jgi:hypothetical protein
MNFEPAALSAGAAAGAAAGTGGASSPNTAAFTPATVASAPSVTPTTTTFPSGANPPEQSQSVASPPRNVAAITWAQSADAFGFAGSPARAVKARPQAANATPTVRELHGDLALFVMMQVSFRIWAWFKSGSLYTAGLFSWEGEAPAEPNRVWLARRLALPRGALGKRVLMLLPKTVVV